MTPASVTALLLEQRYACEHQHHRDCTPDCSCPHDGSSSGKMLIDSEVLAQCAIVVPARFRERH
jgi:hypothetical protein